MIIAILMDRINFDGVVESAGVLTICIYLCFIILLSISMWLIYEKAGQPGWACIVPGYNFVVYSRIIGRPAWWPFVYIAAIAVLTGLSKLLYELGQKDISSAVIFLPFILWVIDTNRFCRSFGKKTGFTLWIFFFSYLVIPLLAFSNSQYEGPNGTGRPGNDLDPDILHE